MRRLRVLLLAILIDTLSMIAVSVPNPVTPDVQSAAAYYGEVEGYVQFPYPGTSNQGCWARVQVMNARRIQPYCWMYNVQTGVYAGNTNYYEYDCWSAWGCTYYISIGSWSYPWIPIGFYHLKKTDYGGQHAIIMEARAQ